MMKRIKSLFKNKAFLALFLALILGSLIILPNIIINKGVYSLDADFNYQQIPFNKMINDSIKEGSFLWTWFNEFGSNMIGTYGFYNIFSPFNIIGYLFPSDIFQYLIGPIYILKYGICGLTSFLFLKRYVKNKNYAVLGSLLYTFSGFQLTNILFYHFHDVVAFFPLLLYTLDNLIYDNKKGRFAICVALCAITNWFFFIGQCVFLAIYFLVKFFTKEYKITLKTFINILIEGVLGVGIAMFVLIPCALFTMGNTRLSTAWSFMSSVKHPIFRYFEILRAFIFPSEVMSMKGIISPNNFTSVEAYLPVVGSVLAISYFFKNYKKWISILMLILGIFMIVPILNSSFVLFQATYYARWFYMATLILSLMSIKCLEDNLKINIGVILSVICALLFFLGLFVYSSVNEVIFNKTCLILFLSFMIINLTLLCFWKKRKYGLKFLICAIFLFVTFWGNKDVFYYKVGTFKTSNYYERFLDSDKYISLDKNSRSNGSITCEFNYGYILRNNNIRVFNSNVNSSSFLFHQSLNLERSIYTNIDIKDKDMNSFLGVKYVMSCGDDLSYLGYELLYNTENGYYIYSNPSYYNFGFSLDDYISQDEFNNLSYEERRKVILDKVVMSDEQIEKYKDLFGKNVYYSSNEFEFINNGFISNITSSGDTLAIYTIPYDKGFSAMVNGKDAKIEMVDNGFMAVKINEGDNKIVFKYFTPGLKIGSIVSILSLIMYFIYMIVNNKKEKISH